jgi:outer membrane protein assembly factor BamD
MKKFILIVLSLFLFSCNAKEEKFTAKIHFDNAIKNFKSKNYFTSLSELEKIESDFPYSSYSVRAEIMSIFIHYLNKDYHDSINASDKFIKLRPANKNIAYIYFIKANSYKKLMADYRKDQSYATESKNNYLKTIARFSDSKYVLNAQKNISLINENIALYYLEISKVLRDDKNPMGAILSLKHLTKFYPNSNFTAEGYFRLAEIYYSLNLQEQARYELKRLKLFKGDKNDDIWKDKAKIFEGAYLNNAKTN